MSSSTTYEPRGYPAAAIAYLRSLDAGAEVASTPLAEAIDCEPNQFAACVAAAVRHGHLVKRTEGRLLVWRLGDGVPLSQPEDDELPQLLQAPARRRGPGRPSSAPLSRSDAWLDKQKAPAQALRNPQRLRVGVWSDGSVVIEQGGTRLELSAEGALELVGFLRINGPVLQSRET